MLKMHLTRSSGITSFLLWRGSGLADNLFLGLPPLCLTIGFIIFFAAWQRTGLSPLPLLFVLSIEPLAITQRSLGDYQGILRRGREHRVSLCADDLLLYVRNPIESIPSIISVLKVFGRISVYKLNLSKSELLPINKVKLQTFI